MIKHVAFLLLVVFLLISTGASAGVFTVVLNNGQTFDTRYYPVDAEWDESVSMILSDQGNWIALEKGDIAEVTSTIDESGFGYRIDTSTVVVGWTYNEDGGTDGGAGAGGAGGFDGVGGVAGGAGGLGGAAGAGAAGQPAADDGGYSIDQFVSTGAAGAAGGIPLEYTSYQ